ncbi:hypothetical protein HBN50_08230 [Halobacteriovorax sp. GB3]|uniref:hypothetical protein n=1 Tax=Halobacteriovorax sp. GB3 TaxID=2719615 RepID=UPI002361CF73|nr:hypothetical protein [Halobacteriovorax sp. GB3]MDD0853080.1 hypothetical protein [Halobacteriovorax sp. GB3]
MKIQKLLVIYSLLMCSLVDARTLIKAEETKYRYIVTQRLENGLYEFSECAGEYLEELSCSRLPGINRAYSAREIKSLADMNERQAYYAAGADVAIVAASLYFGMILAAKATAAYYVAAGASLDGGVAAIGGVLGGTSSGGAVSSVVTISVDALDPFVHRDVSIALEEVIGIASDSNLEDVEAKEYGEDVIVEIEDINYDQLKNKIISQLEDLD